MRRAPGVAAVRRGLYNSEVVETLLADPNQHHTPLRSNVLWQLGLLELWLQRHGIAVVQAGSVHDAKLVVEEQHLGVAEQLLQATQGRGIDVAIADGTAYLSSEGLLHLAAGDERGVEAALDSTPTGTRPERP